MMLSENDLKDFLNVFEDVPLEPDNRFYVAYLKEANQKNEDEINDPIELLVRNIMWVRTNSVNLLSGQRGNGKSTELRRLRKLLEQEGCVVFLCDMQNYINLYFPIEITDFLVSIMLAFSDAIQDKYGKNFTKRSYGERLKDFLTQTKIQFEEAGFGFTTEYAFFKIALKQDPTFKQKLQKDLRGHITNFMQQTHDFSQDMVNFVRNKMGENKKIVLLIDSVEQIRGVGGNATEVHDSVQNLFNYHFDKLHLNDLHVVYTVPPYLPTLAPAAGNGNTYQIPSVHVFNRDGTPDSTGLAVMENIVERRFAQWQQVFSREQLRELVLSTGGDFREFFRLIKIFLVKIPVKNGNPLIPVEDKIIENAKKDLRRQMLPIAKDDMEWLRKIAAGNRTELQSIEELPRLARFFDNNLVQNYRNGDDWYDIHPLLKDVIKELPEN